MSVTNIFTQNAANLGDKSSSPLLYFKFPNAIGTADFNSVGGHFGDVIIGGGGLLWSVDRLLRIVNNTRGRIISWGIGHNTGGERELVWPDCMSRFTLHGVRDWDSGYNWVPCVSCMHPSFDRTYQVTTNIVHYEHRRKRTGITGIPTMRNNEASIEKAIEFLARAEVILTNSYHGAYWGLLLGRKVIVVNPCFSRFFHFRFQPVIATHLNWRDLLTEATSYQDALSISREANMNHFERVCDIIF